MEPVAAGNSAHRQWPVFDQTNPLRKSGSPDNSPRMSPDIESDAILDWHGLKADENNSET
jgi:hypothetical protein